VADSESNCINGEYFVTPQRVILNRLKHCGGSTDRLVQHSETLNFASSTSIYDEYMVLTVFREQY
jgi:hypothetical protein